MIKAIKHLHTINTHRRQVRKICFKLGIYFQGLVHDLSKYSWTEFHQSVKYYTDGKRSPTETERQAEGYSSCWMHHRGRNKHHIEYWFDLDPVTHFYHPLKIPLKYLKEMFADRVAASKVYKKKDYNDGCALEYFLSHENTSKLMQEDSYNTMKEWLTLLKEKGEKEACKIIRKIKKY